MQNSQSLLTKMTTAFIAAGALGFVGAVQVSATASAAQPVPDSDPFYAVPGGISKLAPGSVIRSRSVTIPASSTVIGAANATELLYRTVDNQNQPTATVATIIQPVVPWLAAGPKPLLAYQAAEDGLSTTCAPSYLMTSGSPDFALDGASVTQALAQGWTVLVPDYEGPGSDFLGATGEPREILDAIRATIAYPDSGVTTGSPVGLWGESGGAYATALAAQIQSTYAPELSINAFGFTALPADLNAALSTLAGDPTAPLIPFLIAAMEHSSPQANLGQYLSSAEQAVVKSVSSDCLTQAQGSGTQVSSLASIEASPGSITGGAFYDFVQSISPVGVTGTPTAPVVDVHGLIDQIAPLSADRSLMLTYCADGVDVTHAEIPAEHTTSIALGGPIVVAYLAARFAGISPPMSCGVIPTP